MHLSTEELLRQIPKEVGAITKRVRLDQQREEWLKKRRGRITASGVGKLFTKALMPADNKTALQYICERVAEREGAVIPRTTARAMEWGNEQEPFAVIAYMKDTGYQVTNWGDGEAYEVGGIEYQSDGQEFLLLGNYEGATPDGLILVKDKSLQVKCPENPGIHRMYCLMKTWEDIKKIEPVYYAQMQHEMRVVRGTVGPNVTSCDFVSYDPRNDERPLKIIEIPYDEAFQDILEQTIKEKSKLIQQLSKRA